jgi:hypothetical protein
LAEFSLGIDGSNTAKPARSESEEQVERPGAFAKTRAPLSQEKCYKYLKSITFCRRTLLFEGEKPDLGLPAWSRPDGGSRPRIVQNAWNARAAAR